MSKHHLDSLTILGHDLISSDYLLPTIDFEHSLHVESLSKPDYHRQSPRSTAVSYSSASSLSISSSSSSSASSSRDLSPPSSDHETTSSDTSVSPRRVKRSHTDLPPLLPVRASDGSTPRQGLFDSRPSRSHIPASHPKRQGLYGEQLSSPILRSEGEIGIWTSLAWPHAKNAVREDEQIPTPDNPYSLSTSARPIDWILPERSSHPHRFGDSQQSPRPSGSDVEDSLHQSSGSRSGTPKSIRTPEPRTNSTIPPTGSNEYGNLKVQLQKYSLSLRPPAAQRSKRAYALLPFAHRKDEVAPIFHREISLEESDPMFSHNLYHYHRQDLCLPEVQSLGGVDFGSAQPAVVEKADPFLVSYAPDDPRHPYNRSFGWKYAILSIICMTTACVMASSSIQASTFGQLINEFHLSRIEAVAGISLYVLGLGLGARESTHVPRRSWLMTATALLGPMSEYVGRRNVYLVSCESAHPF